MEGSEVEYSNGVKFVVIKFSKKHDKNKNADKIINEIKIPVENEMN